VEDVTTKAVEGDLVLDNVHAKRYAVKAVVFPKRDGAIAENFDTGKGGIVDLPSLKSSLVENPFRKSKPSRVEQR